MTTPVARGTLPLPHQCLTQAMSEITQGHSALVDITLNIIRQRAEQLAEEAPADQRPEQLVSNFEQAALANVADVRTSATEAAYQAAKRALLSAMYAS